MLTSDEKTELRQFLAAKARQLDVPVAWLKAQVNAAAEAVNDLLEGTTVLMKADIPVGGATLPQILNSLMNTASDPLTFSADLKKAIVAKVIELKFRRDQ